MSTHVCPGKKERVGGGGGMALHCLNTAKKIWQVALVQEPSRAASAAEPATHSVDRDGDGNLTDDGNKDKEGASSLYSTMVSLSEPA